MKVWYVADGFDDEEMDNAPWEYDIDWDEMNLYITLGDKKPTANDKILMVGYSFDGVITLPKESAMFLREWPLDELSKGFFKYLIKTIFKIDKLGTLKWT